MASFRYYPDCGSAHAAGVYSIAGGEPGHRDRWIETVMV
jgi:hypothetical protein